MRPLTIGLTIPLLLVLFLGQGCADDPPARLVPVIDLLDLVPPGRAPEGWESPAAERLAWDFFNGLPDGWAAGPDGVRVTVTAEGLRLECDGAEPWLELQHGIDPLLHDRLVVTLSPLSGGDANLQFSYHRPGNYRPYSSKKKALRPEGKVQRWDFKVPAPDAAESVIHSTRLRLGGSGSALIRQAALVPRPKQYIRGKLLPRERIPLSQEFKRSWRLADGGQRTVTFTVPHQGAWLGFATGTLLGTSPATCMVELVAGGAPKQLTLVPVPLAGEGWSEQRADLGRWAGREITLRFVVQTDDTRAIHLIGRPTIFAAEQESRPNVLLIMVDTLRADRLSGYGHHRQTTPHLDRLARQGLLFTAASAPASWTIPSVAATLTGRYPGSDSIGHGRLAGVPDGMPTLAGILGDQGYSTAGFSANALLDDARGFHRGFGHYFLSPYTDNQFTAEELNRRALSWFERHEDERFFCYLHYMDPHNPYDAPPFRTGPVDPDSPTAWQGGHVRALIAGEVTVDRPEDLERINRFYDEEISYVDRQIGLLLARLRQQGLLDQTVIILTADHGEELHDRGGWGHGFTLYQELIHVPLILLLPDETAQAPGLRSVPVSLVDVLPTIAGLTGLVLDGHELPGHSLLAPVADRFLRSGIWGKRAPDLYTVIRGPRKYVYLNALPNSGKPAGNRKRLETVREVPGTELFFDLAADPGERHDRAGETPETESALRQEMARWLVEMRAAPSPDGGERGTIDIELEEKLRAMGYMK